MIAFIPARGGSKGVPGKNIKEICGKPLIAWTIEAAKKAKGIDRVIVTTDDLAIAAVAQEYGAEVPFLRPAELSSDTASDSVRSRKMRERRQLKLWICLLNLSSQP